jgi:hypothetical protein
MNLAESDWPAIYNPKGPPSLLPCTSSLCDTHRCRFILFLFFGLLLFFSDWPQQFHHFSPACRPPTIEATLPLHHHTLSVPPPPPPSPTSSMAGSEKFPQPPSQILTLIEGVTTMKSSIDDTAADTIVSHRPHHPYAPTSPLFLTVLPSSSNPSAQQQKYKMNSVA